jgi:hypothetical protein
VCANREPNITSETRIESFRDCVRSPVVCLVGGCVGGYGDVSWILTAVGLKFVASLVTDK